MIFSNITPTTAGIQNPKLDSQAFFIIFSLKSEMKSAVVIIHKRWFSVKKYHQSPSAISATPTTAGTGFFAKNPKSNKKINIQKIQVQS